MSLSTLNKQLKTLPHVYSANQLARQHSLSASSVCNVLKQLGYQYTGEGWTTPPQPNSDKAIQAVKYLTDNEYIYNGETWQPQPHEVSERNTTNSLLFSSETIEKIKKRQSLELSELEDSLQTAVSLNLYHEIIVSAYTLYLKSGQPRPLIL